MKLLKDTKGVDMIVCKTELKHIQRAYRHSTLIQVPMHHCGIHYFIKACFKRVQWALYVGTTSKFSF